MGRYLVFVFLIFFCTRQTNNLNMKQQPQKQKSPDIFWLNLDLEKTEDFDNRSVLKRFS